MKRSVLGLAGLILGACAVEPAVLGEGPEDASPEGGGEGGDATHEVAGTTAEGGSGAMPAAGATALPPGGDAGQGASGGTGQAGTGGGNGGNGGSGGTGANAGSDGSAGSGGTAAVASCEFTVATSLSPKIPTVGIVEWSTTFSNVASARIEFGLTTSYGMTAPATARSSENRTLLLGMKQQNRYHYRLVVSSEEGTCYSDDYTLDTGLLLNGLPTITVTTNDAEALAGGFLVTGMYSQGGDPPGGPAFILDADGDIVWAYVAAERDTTGVRQSYDGEWMWINSANVPESQGANVHRVSMDGLEDENLTDRFAGQSHQLTVLPDETVAFYAYSDDGCDEIKEYDPASGEVVTIFATSEVYGAPCHVNAIEYSPFDDTLIYSELEHDTIAKVTRAGELVWVLGGSNSSFTGPGASWSRQHGLHPLGVDRLLFFNNGTMSGGGGSTMIEVLLDLDEMTAERVWTYADSASLRNDIMGDVQRLPNGNTLVAYSTKGVVQEVTAAGEVAQELVWSLPGAFGYIQKRQSLYGPPPR